MRSGELAVEEGEGFAAGFRGADDLDAVVGIEQMDEEDLHDAGILDDKNLDLFFPGHGRRLKLNGE